MKIARIYLRVSTDGQDLQRQERIIAEAQATGYYVAGVYREKTSGARADRPELLRMIDDLQAGEIVIAEKIDRISRLPLEDAQKLVATIRDKGAKLAVPGIVDLSEVSAEADGVARVVLESVQDMLLKVGLGSGWRAVIPHQSSRLAHDPPGPHVCGSFTATIKKRHDPEISAVLGVNSSKDGPTAATLACGYGPDFKRAARQRLASITSTRYSVYD